MKKKSIIVIFGKESSQLEISQYDEVIRDVRLEQYVDPGSIYEAAQFNEALSKILFPDG